ncbi:Retrovirus-related Pol polyprotein from transposon RE1 [Vitis vinifera]|uniref:Retrovirus-related Pol polyprotein from transposon RE1 n=1 Tax=Vitis vinifera TaxID=29760 RepID=A0A438JH83_VITVI|nr:Retrovirus-related Pol polyprotein from transposon RE1 [Vitis vinifera]
MSEVAETTTTAQSEEIVRSQQSGELQNIQAAYRLDGKNYLKWSQLVRTVLKGKGKISHLMGTGPKPGDPHFEAWDEEDSMIMAWLWNSMTPEISNTCMFLAIAKDIWDAIQQTYSKARDAAQVYEVEVKTIAAKQGSKTDAAILKDFIEQDRVYDFLVGLNPEFDQVRIQILGKQEVPCFNEVAALIRGKESRRSVMFEPQTLDGSTLVAKTEYSKQGNNNLPKHLGRDNQWKENKDNLWCTFCKKPRHTKEKCWKLNGKPPSCEWGNRGGQQRPQAHMSEQPKTEENSTTGGFNSEEMEKLRSLLGSLDKPTGTSSLALSGTPSLSFCINVSHRVYDDSWIIDSGATDYMTSKSQLFHTYTPSPSNKKIAVVNGSLATVAGTRLGRRIGLAKERSGLYHLESSQKTSVNTPQQNGVAERKNGHLLNTTRALLFQGNVPKSYWGEDVLTATYMINRIPSQVLDNKSLVVILKSFYPHFRTSNGLTPRVFGCTAFVHVHNQHRDKLDPRAIKCVFLVLSLGEISMMEDSPYESFEPLDLPHVSTHGDEEPVSSSVPTSVTHNFPQFPKVSDPPLHTQPGETSTDSTNNLDLDLPIAIRKGTRECTNRPLYPLSHYVSLKQLSPAQKNFIVSLNTTIIPNTVSEALTKREWKDAMIEEMSALEKNKTWEIVKRPEGKNIVDCKWIFTLKYKAGGSLERHKARFVAKGYTQTYGVDYQETFAPVAKMNTVRILLSLTAHYNWQLLQYDVKNAFLHGDLDKEIYMNIPPGFEENTGNKVCKLKKALYELKQSPRAWFGRFANVMKESGYKQSQEKHEVKQRLATEFEIKELRKLKYFLGIEVAYSTQGIFISQQKYVTDLLAETRKIGCKPVSTPMDPNHKLGEAKEEPMVDKRMSQRLVGRLIYLAHTRPDIAYSVSVISQFMHDPREPHLQAAYRVLHYLKGNPDKGILFKKNNTLALEAYTDADYAGSLVDRRSTTGYCTFLGGNLVTWRSKKQNVVARSSAESKFRVIAQGLCELLWPKIILDDLRIK